MVNMKKRKRSIKAWSFFTAFLLMFSFALYQTESLKDITEISIYGTENTEESVNEAVNANFITADVEDDRAVLKLFGLIPVKKVGVNKISTENIYLGGQAFGIKLFTKGVVVIGLTDISTSSGAVCPAEKAGISKGDIILSVNGKEAESAEMFGELISKCGAKGAVLHCKRGETEFDATVSPVISSDDNKFKIGLWVRDSTAGIGTVTFIDKETGMFGGLGHGVCDVDTSLLMPLSSGTVVDVEITGVIKGEPNTPGELKGNFMGENIGELDLNAETGIFGRINDSEEIKGRAVSIGTRDSVTEGKVCIYTTVSGTTPKEYEAEIIKIFDESGKTKNFMIKVTDQELLKITGGIVQGMSGSPILQNGKLIGAVTHVLINDPTRGYGIFIENMLDTANSLNTLSEKAA